MYFGEVCIEFISRWVVSYKAKTRVVCKKSLLVELILSTISFIWTMNSNGPIMEPWGKTALTKVYMEVAPGNTILCWLFLRQSKKQFNGIPLMTAFCDLDVSPLCHTLSKVLLISQNIERTSLPLRGCALWLCHFLGIFTYFWNCFRNYKSK